MHRCRRSVVESAGWFVGPRNQSGSRDRGPVTPLVGLWSSTTIASVVNETPWALDVPAMTACTRGDEAGSADFHSTRNDGRDPASGVALPDEELHRGERPDSDRPFQIFAHELPILIAVRDGRQDDRSGTVHVADAERDGQVVAGGLVGDVDRRINRHIEHLAGGRRETDIARVELDDARPAADAGEFEPIGRAAARRADEVHPRDPGEDSSTQRRTLAERSIRAAHTPRRGDFPRGCVPS